MRWKPGARDQIQSCQRLHVSRDVRCPARGAGRASSDIRCSRYRSGFTVHYRNPRAGSGVIFHSLAAGLRNLCISVYLICYVCCCTIFGPCPHPITHTDTQPSPRTWRVTVHPCYDMKEGEKV